MYHSPRGIALLSGRLPPASLDLNFLAGLLDSSITFTRAAGPATYFDASGTLQTAETNVARFDYDPATLAPRGLLIEEARTNSIRNANGTGASAGSPGTLPTNWQASPIDGISRSVIGTGVENGIPYVDIRYSGTTTNPRSNVAWWSPDTSTGIAAANGQTWTCAHYLRVSAGSLANITATGLTVSEYTAGGSFLTQTNTAVSLTGVLTRISTTRTLNNASTGCVVTSLLVSYLTGNAIDVTIRFAGPQLELGAFPTSYIPTTGAAATRAVDVATMPQVPAAAASLVVDALQTAACSKATTLAAFTGASGKTGLTVNASNQVAMFDTTGSLNTSLGSEPIGSAFKAGLSWQAGRQLGSLNGATATAATAASLTASETTLSLGYDGTSQQPNGYLRRVRYWPVALSAQQLQQVTL